MSARSARPPNNNVVGPAPDVIMGPPPLPHQVVFSTSQGSASASGGNNKQPQPPDVAEKYSRLKRRFFEMEEKLKDCVLERDAVCQRLVKYRSERE
ncbi:hypothetical protein K474DRAFT_109838 [Panus rudis PR-1116 ss-1]|nr:hypothetical protein K474DRAFT_109838 [Panus rudis PR-1116 ss-1]